ncbi:SusD/RagB family nutrient-binding outer membrane lipoprotein [Filimonas effusa]|uniref:SusD/RagB family nutrient-binding outer membrane lipoprotein n=1 Tax=Filimonas effusa TaxID=2508721 RepID=A0A4Q1D8Z2_9BACT|nr:SusD/RagB family nutrient-binding outer membrane lipoprotein [Filimonas effusa]RXK85781.1 SusD/RagB family nutrient-binding outer membrane lipoprotein [Filimonas effusa]
MKKNIIIIVLLGMLSSCTKNIDELNEQTKKPTAVPPSALFSNAEKNLTDILTSPSVNYNIFRLNVQHWAETTYQDESRYNLAGRNIPQSFWNSLYRDVLNSLAEAKKAIPLQDPQFTTAGQRRNQLAMADILQVYAWSVLVNTFGDIPYKQALDIDKYPLPVYDDAKTTYYDLLTRLDTSIAALDEGEAAFSSSDLLYGSDIVQWKAFANSLKLRMGIIIADSDPAKAAEVIAAAAPEAILSSSDNAVFQYEKAPPNTNPVWVELIQSGRHDFVIGQTFADSLLAYDDPRIPLFFTRDAAGGYSGGVIGGNPTNKWGTYSKPADAIQQPAFESVLIDNMEVEFILAEAAARGIQVGGTAVSHYNAGVTASILYWGGTASQASSYLAGKGSYANQHGTYREKIGFQKWIALYNRGYDAWTEVRRLDYPVLPAPNRAVSDFPVRYTYPAQEQTLNTANYKNGSTAIGGDLVTTKLFWDLY